MKKSLIMVAILLAAIMCVSGCAPSGFRRNADNYTGAELSQFTQDIQFNLERKAALVEVRSVNKHLQAIIYYKGSEYNDYFGDIIVNSMNVCKEVIGQAGVWLFLNDDYDNLRFTFTGFDKEETANDCVGMFFDTTWPIDCIGWIDGYSDIVHYFPYITTIFDLWASDWNYQ